MYLTKFGNVFSNTKYDTLGYDHKVMVGRLVTTPKFQDNLFPAKTSSSKVAIISHQLYKRNS